MTEIETPSEWTRLGRISAIRTHVTGREGESVTCDGAKRQHKHDAAMHVLAEGKGAQQMAEADAKAAEDHQRAPADAVHEQHGEYGEDQVDRPGDDDIEQDLIGAVAGAAINLCGVVEEDVDACPLLQYGERDADKEDAADGLLQQLAS